jgi:hypothetical protein
MRVPQRFSEIVTAPTSAGVWVGVEAGAAPSNESDPSLYKFARLVRGRKRLTPSGRIREAL